MKKFEVKTHKAVFNKDSKSSFRIRSTKNKTEFWIDPKDWAFNKAVGDTQVEYKFRLKGKDLYGMAITEKVQVDIAQYGANRARECQESRA